MLRRNAGWLVVAVAAIVLVGVYVAGLPGAGPSRAPIARARARLSACLLGEPVDVRAGIDHRLRTVDVAARNAGVTDWPARCAPFAEELEPGASAELAAGALYDDRQVAPQIRAALVPLDGEPVADWSDAVRGVPLAPPATALPELELLSTHRPRRVTGSPHLVLQLDEREACTFRAQGGGLEPIARCTGASDVLVGVEGPLWLLGSGADELLARARDGTIRRFATGETVLSGAFGEADVVGGALIAVTHGAILRRDAAGAPVRIALDRPRGHVAEDVTLVGGMLLWQERDRLLARDVAGSRPGPVVEVGRIRGELAPVRWCTGGDTIAAMYQLDDDADDAVRLALRIDGAWRLTGPVPRGALACGTDRVDVTQVDGEDNATRVSRTRCTGGGCTTVTETVAGVADGVATALGDATILVWADDTVHAVVAPVGELARAAPVVLFDGFASFDHWVHGAQTLIHDLAVDVRGSSAIVTIHTDIGTVALHVGADAAVTPVAVVRE